MSVKDWRCGWDTARLDLMPQSNIITARTMFERQLTSYELEDVRTTDYRVVGKILYKLVKRMNENKVKVEATHVAFWNKLYDCEQRVRADEIVRLEPRDRFYEKRILTFHRGHWQSCQELFCSIPLDDDDTSDEEEKDNPSDTAPRVVRGVTGLFTP